MVEEKKKILLVDDNIDNRIENKSLLESRGYEVVTAENSLEGWSKFQKIKPDAALIDLIMEELDSGFILCYKIKNDAHGKNIPLFLLTSAAYLTGFKFGSSTSEEKEWIKCDEVINKPIQIDQLVMKLESYFRHYELKPVI